MIRCTSLSSVVFLILIVPQIWAGPDPESIEILKTKWAEVKGDIPSPLISSESPPPKCGTPLALAVHAMSRYPEYQSLASLLQRPDLPDTFGTSHFLIHYTTIGLDSVYQPGVDSIPGVPVFVSRTASILENVWRVEIDSLGYRAPLSDSGNGGDSRFDIYYINLGPGFYGFTTQDTLVNYGFRSAGYITLENDFAGTRYSLNPIPAVKVTAAHEFFHAVQFAYDPTEFDFDNPNNWQTYKPWWLEASSTWMEETVYDAINDYISYLPYFYHYMWMGMGTFSYDFSDPRSFHPYASAVWPLYLTQKYNLDVMRQIWDICGQVPGYNTLPATNTVLSNLGSSLPGSFLEFEVWNFHTGDPNRGGHADTIHFFREGNLYPVAETTAFIGNLTTGPVSLAGLPHPPEHLATNYVIMQSNPDAAGGVAVNFNGANINNAEWHVAILGYRPGDSKWVDMQVDPHSGDGVNGWQSWDLFTDIILVPTVSGLTAQYVSYPYTGTVSYDPSLINDTLGTLKLALDADNTRPSPFLIQDGTSLRIVYSLDKTYNTKEITLWIYDLSGHKVREISGNQFLTRIPGLNSAGVRWDGKNDRGKYVASGIYILLLEAGGKSATGKIAVINNQQ